MVLESLPCSGRDLWYTKLRWDFSAGENEGDERNRQKYKETEIEEGERERVCVCTLATFSLLAIYQWEQVIIRVDIRMLGYKIK